MSQPIIGGSADLGDMATVLIGGGGVWCTGTLISPKVVLTAGHCVAPGVPPRNFVWFGSAYQGGGGTYVGVAKYYPQPNYTQANFQDGDIGIVVLKSPADVTPMAFNKTALDDSYVGKSLRLVGFGGTGSPTPFGVKMQITTPIASVEPTESWIGQAICSGDSGGPGFLELADGQETIAGVISWQSSANGCGKQGGLARVDVLAAWIQAQIDAEDPPDAGATSDASSSGTGGFGAGGAGGGSVSAGTGVSGAPMDPGGSTNGGGCRIGAARPKNAGYLMVVLAAMLAARRLSACLKTRSVRSSQPRLQKLRRLVRGLSVPARERRVAWNQTASISRGRRNSR